MNPSMSQRYSMLMRHKSNVLMFGAIIVCACFILAMPVVPQIRALWIDAMHGRIESAPTMLAVQVVPKMYNFANRVAVTDEPMTPEQLRGMPMSLPLGGEYVWMNHYPSWLLTSSPVSIIPNPEDSPKYVYLFSKWRGVDTITGYKVERHSEPRAFIVTRVPLDAPASPGTTPSKVTR